MGCHLFFNWQDLRLINAEKKHVMHFRCMIHPMTYQGARTQDLSGAMLIHFLGGTLLSVELVLISVKKIVKVLTFARSFVGKRQRA